MQKVTRPRNSVAQRGLRSKSRSDRLLQLTKLVGGANLNHKYRYQYTNGRRYQDGECDDETRCCFIDR